MPHSNEDKGRHGDGAIKHSRSAQARKADEIRAAGSAEAGAGQDEVTEGGKAEAPTEGKGRPKPATSRAEAEGGPDAGTSAATAGRAEKENAAASGAAKEHGRGHRKAD